MPFDAAKIVIISSLFLVGKELNFGKENKFKIYEAYKGTLIKFQMPFDAAKIVIIFQPRWNFLTKTSLVSLAHKQIVTKKFTAETPVATKHNTPKSTKPFKTK